MKMRFDVECVWKMLNDVGIVFTVRKYELKDEVVFVEGIGKCKRSLVGEISKVRDLKEYWKLSGFEKLGDWVDVIKRMYGSKRKFLYCVEVISGGGPNAQIG